MSDTRTVEVAVTVAPGAYLNVSRELEIFGVRIGAWYIGLEGGNLVVREHDSAQNATPLLKVPA